MNKTIKHHIKEALLWDAIKQDYHIEELLGQGSYGKVMKCIGKKDGQVYAIKLIADVFDDIHYLKQLVREIHIMR
jgi:serine/threonine protein kinase